MSAPTALSIEWVKETDNPTHSHVVLGRPFKVKVACDQPAVTAIDVTLTVKTGTGVLTGITTGTITVGTSSVEINDVYYSKEEDNVVIKATGEGLTAGDSAAVDVIALRLVVISINDGNDVENGVAFDVVLRLVDPDGDYHAPGVSFIPGVSSSTGAITGVTPAEFAADELADVVGSYTFCGPAGVDRVLTATGFTGVTGGTLNFDSILGAADHLTLTTPNNGKAFCPDTDITVTAEIRDVCEYVLEDDNTTVVTFAAPGFAGTGNATVSSGVATKTLNTGNVMSDTAITVSSAGLSDVSVSLVARCLQAKCGTLADAIPILLMKCGTAGNAVPTLLRSCTTIPPEPKDICTEFNNAPDPYSFYLKFTWSGALTRCTDCWNLNSYNHWLCTAAPTTLPSFSWVNSCLENSGALPSAYTLVDYIDFCGGTDTWSYSDSWASCLWECVDGVFRLAVYGNSHYLPMFYAEAFGLKDGDVLANQLGCLSYAGTPCGSSFTFPSFVTGGSYKVEIFVP